MFNALDEKTEKAANDGEQAQKIVSHNINYRAEPVAFFFVLFGISFEALAGKNNEDSGNTKQRTLDIVQAMHKILRPSIAGMAIYQDAIFSETMDQFARIMLMEGLEIQTVIVNIVRNLCLAHPFARRSQEQV